METSGNLRQHPLPAAGARPGTAGRVPRPRGRRPGPRLSPPAPRLRSGGPRLPVVPRGEPPRRRQPRRPGCGCCPDPADLGSVPTPARVLNLRTAPTGVPRHPGSSPPRPGPLARRTPAASPHPRACLQRCPELTPCPGCATFTGSATAQRHPARRRRLRG